ncbi:hypothetical protein GQ53DRAFT_741197 [Thozetella sp. PMI_491]|nr:hypothetical protein GQ53DRAFT_741197 [Thozetella sp. PMI_491]
MSAQKKILALCAGPPAFSPSPFPARRAASDMCCRLAALKRVGTREGATRKDSRPRSVESERGHTWLQNTR